MLLLPILKKLTKIGTLCVSYSSGCALRLRLVRLFLMNLEEFISEITFGKTLR